MQVFADDAGRNSLFVLTGSDQFSLSDAISQSLAGRTALLRLLPFSLAKRRQTGASELVDDILYSGCYPRIHDQKLDPRQALADYFETYVERHVRQIAEIRNLSSFRQFVRLCAGRVGQLANLSALGADAGVTHTTAGHWLTVLEASYVMFRLPPFFANLRKRVVKSHKLYFYDVGLVSHLIGIEHPRQIATHPLRGQLFENAVVMEALKHRFNQGRRSNLSFFRDARRLECDLLYETAHGIGAIEIKSGATFASDYLRSLGRVADLIPEISAKAVVYGGQDRQSRSACEVVPLNDVADLLERLDVDQELASFVQDRIGAEPNDSDIRMLDLVFRVDLRPILDGLASRLAVLSSLFTIHSSSDYVDVGKNPINGTLLTASIWERTKKQHIVNRRFKLADDRKLELRCCHTLTEYTGIGGSDFSVVVTIAWKLSADSFSREVTINDTLMPIISDRIVYTKLKSDDYNVTRIVTVILKNVKTQIENRSNE